MANNLSGFRIVHMSEKMDGILKERRVILGLTQQQVAERAGIKTQQYQRLESGERSIMSASFRMACRILEALELDVSKFYHGDYILGEEIYLDKAGLRYVRNGEPVNKEE